MFPNTPHSISDFYTSLTGPDFHISKNIFVHNSRETEEDIEYRQSEWGSLTYTNRLLSDKFGNRSRGYVEHIAKPISVEILQEVSKVFATEIARSDKFQFREGKQVNMLFLAT
jgi:hypothetical protein